MAIAAPTSSHNLPPVDAGIVQRVAWSTATNYAAKIVSMGLGVLLTPFVLREVGPASYGLWALVGSVTGYGTLLDLGISSALIKYVAEYSAKREYARARDLIATGLRVYGALGLIVIALSGLLAPLFPQVFHVGEADRASAALLVFVAGAGIGVWLPCSTAGAVLRGLHRFDLVNVLQITNTVLTAVATVIVLVNGGGILGLIIANNIVMLLLQGPAIWLIRRSAPSVGFPIRGARGACAAQLVRFSSWVFAVNVAGRMQTKTDEIVIGAYLPVAAVTPYALANALSDIALMLTDQFMRVLLPLASELHAGGDQSRVRALYLTSTRVSLALFVPIGTTLAILAAPTLTAWVGAQYADYAYLVIILLIADGISASQWPATTVLQAMARHQLLAVAAIVSAIANLFLSIILLQWLGLAGVALGTLVPTTIISLGFVLPFAMRVLHTSAADLLRQVVAPTLLPLVPLLAVAYVLTRLLQPHTLPTLFLVASLSLATYAIAYVRVGASRVELDSYRRLLQGTTGLIAAQLARVVTP